MTLAHANTSTHRVNIGFEFANIGDVLAVHVNEKPGTSGMDLMFPSTPLVNACTDGKASNDPVLYANAGRAHV